MFIFLLFIKCKHWGEFYLQRQRPQGPPSRDLQQTPFSIITAFNAMEVSSESQHRDWDACRETHGSSFSHDKCHSIRLKTSACLWLRTVPGWDGVNFLHMVPGFRFVTKTALLTDHRKKGWCPGRREKCFKKQGCSGSLANSTRSPRREKRWRWRQGFQKGEVFRSRKAERQGLRQGCSKCGHYSWV